MMGSERRHPRRAPTQWVSCRLHNLVQLISAFRALKVVPQAAHVMLSMFLLSVRFWQGPHRVKSRSRRLQAVDVCAHVFLIVRYPTLPSLYPSMHIARAVTLSQLLATPHALLLFPHHGIVPHTHLHM